MERVVSISNIIFKATFVIFPAFHLSAIRFSIRLTTIMNLHDTAQKKPTSNVIKLDNDGD